MTRSVRFRHLSNTDLDIWIDRMETRLEKLDTEKKNIEDESRTLYNEKRERTDPQEIR